MHRSLRVALQVALLEFYNNLTRAESPTGCLWPAGFARFFYVELTLI
ncbi:hypothetical protein [Leptospira noguchii]|uniref:Uncharacterized protein n=1 Tax=Leptospira noguchii TaxID=28182 RepID=A0AAE9K8F1_9LEPT|nr:hypothetical protein [Leptospira noguchii]UOG30969.1 hypothetical protein MAL06_02500 [Leptospira noguchii]UOG57090.1 hypothetical protein MAL03_02480 [Leptospira noguchii]